MLNCDTSRRGFLIGTATGVAATLASPASAKPFAKAPRGVPAGASRLLHMTDIHIRPEHEAPARCTRLINQAIQDAGEIDLVLNGGDSIYAADYNHITRQRVLDQWALWDAHVVKPLGRLSMLSALGNHDMWWATESSDAMYGKDYALERLGQNGRYLSRIHRGWLIAVLDCNNHGMVDDQQMRWLHDLAQQHADLPMLIMSHQPIMMAEQLVHGEMSDRQREILEPFVDPRLEARPVFFLSGHEHVVDQLAYLNVSFLCYGAFSGAWWEFDLDRPGQYEGNNSVRGTPMGYGIIDLFQDGTLDHRYIDTTDSAGGKLITTPNSGDATP